MKWCNEHINLTYTIITLIGLSCAVAAILNGNVVLLILWYIALFASSLWLLWRKQQNYSLLTVVILIAIVGVPLLLALSNKRDEKIV